MKHLKTIARTALLIFVSLVIGFNLYTWNAQSLMGNALPMPFGYGVAVVLTGSMEPELYADDLIFVRAQEDYALRDVVVYQSGSSLVVHRIIETDGETVITKGDANNTADEPIRAEYIKGRVIGRLSGVGGVLRLLKSPAVVIAMAAAALLLLEGSFRKEKKQDSEKLEDIKAEIRRLKAEQEPKE